MSHRLPKIVVFLAVALVFAACGTDDLSLPDNSDEGDGAVTEPSSSLSLDDAWVLVAATVDGTTVALIDQYRVTMTIAGSEINGTAACNGYGGVASIDDGGFAIGEVFSTMMACEPPVMEIESAFHSGLAAVTAAARAGDTLLLTGPNVELQFELVPPVPTAQLIGPTWVLDAIISGDTASSTHAAADRATLVFSSDGTFEGGTGCRILSGQYVVSGDTVQINAFRADGDCGADVASQDGQVISVLEGGFTVQIEGDRLTETGSGGEGLFYRAES